MGFGRSKVARSPTTTSYSICNGQAGAVETIKGLVYKERPEHSTGLLHLHMCIISAHMDVLAARMARQSG